ncbi:transcriptional regulator [Marivita lacus]|uniref:Transcriptional regulator n=1 Tax=Marivita lacus TaxID=1323742 RepID=A0ABQ1LD52_9RHOB|nr:transcriptional regulator [Marivita lacus]
MGQPRNRRETRASILSVIWRQNGAYRTDISKFIDISEASVSRIVADLKAEAIVQEVHRSAPYRGGPSTILTLSNQKHVAAIEVSNNRMHVGIASLQGKLLYSERVPLKDGADQIRIDEAIKTAIQMLADGTQRGNWLIEQIAVTIPGFNLDRPRNPIIDLDPNLLRTQLAARFPGIPVQIENSILARAIAHRLRSAEDAARDRYLYVFAGHGVAGAMIDGSSDAGDVTACELGHMVVDRKGPLCRCGHHGCAEAYASTVAIAPLMKVEEQTLLEMGDSWAQELGLPARVSGALHDRLTLLGIAIGNTLNVTRARRIRVGGWPAAMGAAGEDAIRNGLDMSLLGGASAIDLKFVQSELGREPESALALATFDFLRQGGKSVHQQDQTDAWAEEAIGTE